MGKKLDPNSEEGIREFRQRALALIETIDGIKNVISTMKNFEKVDDFIKFFNSPNKDPDAAFSRFGISQPSAQQLQQAIRVRDQVVLIDINQPFAKQLDQIAKSKNENAINQFKTIDAKKFAK